MRNRQMAKEKVRNHWRSAGRNRFVSTADDLEKQQLNLQSRKPLSSRRILICRTSPTPAFKDNKTIVGSYGNKTIYDSQVRTNDTYGAVDVNPSDNIIFRNLNMIAKNVKNRILINIWSSRQIWVDHCTFISSYLPSDHTETGRTKWENSFG